LPLKTKQAQLINIAEVLEEPLIKDLMDTNSKMKELKLVIYRLILTAALKAKDKTQKIFIF